MAGTVVKAGRTKARRAREACGIAVDVPLPDLLVMAERGLDVPVAMFEWLGEDLAGAYIRRSGRRLVLLNGSDPVVRLRFTLAHELAHHCFGDDAQPDTHAGLARPGHWIEVRANAFAAELLMPHAAVSRWIDEQGLGAANLGDVVRASHAFGVSAIVALYRIDDVGLPLDAARLKAEIGVGLHLEAFPHQSYPDSLRDARDCLPYVSERLRASTLVRAARGELAVDEAARRLGVSEAALRDLWAPFDLLPPA
jgi:Zn-dependent peptidase ImmA (M78 family)